MDFNEYQTKALTTKTYGIGDNIIYPVLGLNGEAGEVAEKVKKILRDNDGYFTEASRDEIAKELGDCLWYIANIANDIGKDFDTIAKMNINKLESRKERGVINGSGDNR